jgi:hypothetical protein
MVAVPAVMPVITPAKLIDAFVDELTHVPPVVVLARVVILPSHTTAVPVIVAGSAFTVRTVEVVQPEPRAYVIVVVPAATPVTTPDASIVAFAGVPLVHVPPVVTLFNVVVRPSQTVSVPVIVAGSALTVTVAVVMQPVGSE